MIPETSRSRALLPARQQTVASDSSGSRSDHRRREQIGWPCTTGVSHGTRTTSLIRAQETPRFVRSSGATARFRIWEHWAARPAWRAGLLRDSPVLSCARRVQRPSDPQVFDQFVANRIKQLPYGLVGGICGLCSRSALTRRRSAVRVRQHPPNKKTLRLVPPESAAGGPGAVSDGSGLARQADQRAARNLPVVSGRIGS